MSRKSEAILDELFSSIKPKKAAAAEVSEDEETEEEEESSEEDSSSDESEREARKRKKKSKKKHKKHKKHKKSHKKHKRSRKNDSSNDEDEEGEIEEERQVRSVRRVAPPDPRDKDNSRSPRKSKSSKNGYEDSSSYSSKKSKKKKYDSEDDDEEDDDQYWKKDRKKASGNKEEEVEKYWKKDRDSSSKYPDSRYREDDGYYRSSGSHREDSRHSRDQPYSRDERSRHGEYPDYRSKDKDGYYEEKAYYGRVGASSRAPRHSSRERDSYRSRDRDERPRRRSKDRRDENESRPPVRPSKDEDVFWDSKWEAMQVQKKAEKQERKGKHFLDGQRRESKTPSPVRIKSRTPSPETEELKRLRKLKEIQELVVKDSEKFVAEPPDKDQFEYDKMSKMWKRKAPEKKKDSDDSDSGDEKSKKKKKKADGDKSYEELLKERMDEQFKEQRKKAGLDKDDDDDEDKKKEKSDSKLTLDEIEEIRKKREKFKKEKEDKQKKKEKKEEDREDGEVAEEEDDDKRRSKSRRSKSRSRSRSRERKRSRSRSRDRDDRRRDRDSRDHYSSSSRRDVRSSRRYSPDDYRYSSRSSRSRRSRSRSPRRGYRDYRYRRSRSRDRSDRRSSRRSRTRSRDRNGFRGSRSAIDKEKLLAIAKKNAVKLLSSDNLMGMDHAKLVAIKSGGQSLSQLTSFCRELQRKGITDDFSDQELGNSDDDDDDKFNHPFEVKDRPLPGIMGNPYNPLAIIGGKDMGLALEHVNPQMKAAAKSHRMLEYPVSSGNSHRVKENMIEYHPDPEKPAGAEQLAITKVEANPEAPSGAFAVPAVPRVLNEMEKEKEKEMSEAEKFNASNPLGVLMFGGAKEENEDDDKKSAPMFLSSGKTEDTIDKEVPEVKVEDIKADLNTNVDDLLKQVEKEIEEKQKTEKALALVKPKPKDNVFSDDFHEGPSKDISEIVSSRLAAMKKLQENPNDPEALAAMYEAQKQMSNWAASKNKPGQFTGHTGAKILTQAELSMGVQAWAKAEQFTNAKKVTGGFGEFMLKKMGWNEGDGLGKNRSGDVDPLSLDIKTDKKGLMSAEEFLFGKKRKGGRGYGEACSLTGIAGIDGKHPVSALMEVASKRRWGPPQFTQAFECGPSHGRQYIFKVSVNGTEFMPSIACDNKKKAKADAATIALIELGLMARDPNNPI